MITEYWQSSDDNFYLYVRKWSDESIKPKAIIQIAHGMVEHIKRYDEFSEFLVQKGFYVYGNDHRGHGQTANHQGLLGYLADKKGFSKLTNDLYTITKNIKQKHENVPIFLLGHSMGSFVVRNFIQLHSEEVDGVILSGTGFYNRTTSLIGKQLASLFPEKKPSKLMNTLTFGTYNKRISNSDTGFEWLSSDTEAVQTYIKDPLTGYIPTARFFYDLLDGLQTIHQPSSQKNIRRNLPMLLLSGTEDPVGNYGKGVWKTAQLYKKAGLNNITTMLFEGGRHEMLHEINKGEVYDIIYEWICKHL